MTTSIIFPNDLQLEEITRHPDGSIASGTVVNGGWVFKREGGKQSAWTLGGSKVHEWPDHPVVERPVKHLDMHSDAL